MKAAATFLATAVLSVFGASSTSTAPTCLNLDRTLKSGSTGTDVSKLQTLLQIAQPTGYFGTQTKQKLIEWQMSHKVINAAKAEGAGTTGPKTRAALRCVPSRSVATSTPPKTAPVPALKPATTSEATVPVTPVLYSAPSSGGGSASQCTPLGAKPPASQCTVNEWQIFQDEAGCDIWYCLEPDDGRG